MTTSVIARLLIIALVASSCGSDNEAQPAQTPTSTVESTTSMDPSPSSQDKPVSPPPEGNNSSAEWQKGIPVLLVEDPDDLVMEMDVFEQRTGEILPETGFVVESGSQVLISDEPVRGYDLVVAFSPAPSCRLLPIVSVDQSRDPMVLIEDPGVPPGVDCEADERVGYLGINWVNGELAVLTDDDIVYRPS